MPSARQQMRRKHEHVGRETGELARQLFADGADPSIASTARVRRPRARRPRRPGSRTSLRSPEPGALLRAGDLLLRADELGAEKEQQVCEATEGPCEARPGVAIERAGQGPRESRLALDRREPFALTVRVGVALVQEVDSMAPGKQRPDHGVEEPHIAEAP